jgi:hypothetical protein
MRQGLRPFGEAAQKQSPPEILLRSAKELEQVLVEKLINYIGTTSNRRIARKDPRLGEAIRAAADAPHARY